MHPHSRCGRKRTRNATLDTPRSRSPRSGRAGDEVFGFGAAFAQMLGGRPAADALRRGRGRPPRVPLTALLEALVFHVMHRFGTLGEHFALLHEDALGDSGCSERRQLLPWQVFAGLMQRALRPLAQTRRHKECFWRGWRLVAVDGSSAARFPAGRDVAQPRRHPCESGGSQCHLFRHG